MFEDSLVESQDRIRTQSRWFAIGSFFAQAALLVLLILYPLLNPLALPRQSIERLLIAPAAPQSPAHVEVHRATAPASHTSRYRACKQQLQAPSRIPTQIAQVTDPGLQPPSVLIGIGGPTGHRNPRRNSCSALAAPNRHVAQTASAETSNEDLFRGRRRATDQPYPSDLSRRSPRQPESRARS